MRILAFSDVHCNLEVCGQLVEAAAGADLVIGAGDFASRHMGLDETIAALAPIAGKAVYVPGNNETFAALREATSAIVLHGGTHVFGETVIAGIGAAIPPLPPLPWGSFDIEETEAEEMLANIDAADILISHSPPKDTVDELAPQGLLGMHGAIGSTAVRHAVERLHPRLVFCGHVHDSWGQRATIGPSMIANLGPTINWFEFGVENGRN